MIPQEAGRDLYNRLETLDTRDAEGHQALLWPARKVARQSPSDPFARVALAEILLACGNRQDGAREAESAWYLSLASQEFALIDAATMLMVWIARFDLAQEGCRLLLNQPGYRAIPAAAGNGLRYSLLAGAADDIRAWARLCTEVEAPGTDGLVEVVEYFDDVGMLVHLAAHQRIVADVLRDYQVQAWLCGMTESGSPFLQYDYALACDKTQRRALSRQMFYALSEYYDRETGEPGLFIGRMSSLLVTKSELPVALTAA